MKWINTDQCEARFHYVIVRCPVHVESDDFSVVIPSLYF